MCEALSTHWMDEKCIKILVRKAKCKRLFGNMDGGCGLIHLTQDGATFLEQVIELY
jgi:hypothetical protein